jgi:hypothetical protein
MNISPPLFGKDAIAEGSQPIQLATLSDAELKETEGALIWKAIGVRAAWSAVGEGAGGAGRHIGPHIGTRQWQNWSWRDFGRSIAWDAAGGAIGGVLGPTRLWSVTGGAFTGGVVSGAGMHWR